MDENVNQVHQNTAGPDTCYHSGVRRHIRLMDALPFLRAVKDKGGRHNLITDCTYPAV